MELPHLRFIGIKCLAVSGTFIRFQKAIRIIALVPAVFQVLPKTVQLARQGDYIPKCRIPTVYRRKNQKQ